MYHVCGEIRLSGRRKRVTSVVSGVAAGCKVGARWEVLFCLGCDILIKTAPFADIASSYDVGTCSWYV